MARGRIPDFLDQRILIIDDTMAPLYKIMPKHLFMRWKKSFDSVSEAARGKDTELDSGAQAEVKAEVSDDDLLSYNPEIEW